MRHLIAFAILLLAAWAGAADDAAPPGGRPMLAADAWTGPAAKFAGEEYGSRTVVAASGMPFASAVRIVTAKRPMKYYHVSSKVLLPAVRAGDALLIRFHARCVAGGNNDTGAGQIEVGLQEKANWSAIARFDADPGSEWQLYSYPLTIAKDLPNDGAVLGLSAGAQLQTVEIGGLEVLNYGAGRNLADLPMTRISYVGREADAAWRAEAESRIEKHRKGDLTVRVLDAAGRPIQGSAVAVRMRRHAFQFGAAITSRCWEDSPQARPILEKHAELFNQGLPITFFVWTVYETSDGRQGAERIMDWLRSKGMTTRAHVLVWERDDHLPTDLLARLRAGDKVTAHKRVEEHIRSSIAAFKGRVDEWVVENEAVDNSELRKVLGETSIADWFRIAREADPQARLMINENRVEGLGPDKSDRLLELVKTVESNGGKIDTIGIQGHFASVPVPPVTLQRFYDKLAATGKALAITEYDFNTTDEELKADYTRDILTMVFSHPSFNCFTFWRFWDGRPEKHESPVYAHDWTLRPSGQVFKDLVFKRWWTEVSGTTGADGCFATRGFLGDYEITASLAGKQVVAKAVIVAGMPGVVELRLP